MVDFDFFARDDFARQYGSWAVIAGGCEPLGAALAQKIAAHGIKLFLIDPRPEPLIALSRAITARYQVEVRAAPLDLTVASGLDEAKALTTGIEAGLLVYDGGVESGAGTFLQRPLHSAMQTVRRNVIGPVNLCHFYAPKMCERGRGGIVLAGSLDGCAGGSEAAYSGCKAFEQIFAESLWHEMSPQGIDVLCCIAANIQTSAQPDAPAASESPLYDLTPDAVAQEALEHLKDGPVWFAGEASRASARELYTVDRRAALRLMSAARSASKPVH